jgi:hypothetical protein
VLKLLPSEYLTQNEIDAASLIAPDVVNVQQQRRIDWPADPAVARAYLDQLGRTNALPTERAAALNAALERADRAIADSSRTSALAQELDGLATDLERDAAAAGGRDQARLQALAESLQALAGR